MVPGVLGLDTDSYGFHWVSTVPILGQKVGYIRSAHEDVEWRRVELASAAFDLFQHAHAVDWVYCEEPLALQNGKTTRLLGLAAGAIFGAFVLSAHDANFKWVDVSAWKKEILGRGTPPKDFEFQPRTQRVKAWIRQETRRMPGFVADYGNGDVFEKNWNLYDAYCIKTFGVREVLLHGGKR